MVALESEEFLKTLATTTDLWQRLMLLFVTSCFGSSNLGCIDLHFGPRGQKPDM